MTVVMCQWSRRPSIITKILFVLAFSGPPRLRLRNPQASLHGIIDWSILLQIAVWGAVIVWLGVQAYRMRDSRMLVKSLPEKLGLLLAVLLSISIAVSGAPELTAFKVYQLLATVLFSSMVVHLYGVDECLEMLFLSTAILCATDTIAAVVAPSLVFVTSELGGLRFRGDLIAQTGVVSVFALILLLTRRRSVRQLAFAAALALFGGVLVFSLMRTAYLSIAVLAGLVSVTKPQIRRLRQFSRVVIVLVPLLIGVRAVSVLDEYRPADSVWSLSDRTGLWSHLVAVTWKDSPLFGLGYFAASRIYGAEYNPDLGTAHSGFVEVFAGGGVPSALVHVGCWCALGIYLIPLIRRGMDRRSFTALALLTSTFLFTLIGGPVEADPVGVMFWCLAAAIPELWRECGRHRAKYVPSHSSHRA